VLRTALSVFALALLAPTPALAQESSPSPTKPRCADVYFSVDKSVITSGDVVTVTAKRDFHAPEQTVTARLERREPEPSAVVRSDSSTSAIVEWPLRLGESHLFSPDYFTSDDCFPSAQPAPSPIQVDVRPVVTIAATRQAPRDYSFTGRVLPARGQFLTLYRHHEGRRIITSQTHPRPDGTYRFDRRFTGSGRFGFSVLASATSASLAGSSNVRPTVIH
jgi:hypothetical protein